MRLETPYLQPGLLNEGLNSTSFSVQIIVKHAFRWKVPSQKHSPLPCLFNSLTETKQTREERRRYVCNWKCFFFQEMIWYRNIIPIPLTADSEPTVCKSEYANCPAQACPPPPPPHGAALVDTFPNQPTCFGGFTSIKPKQDAAEAPHNPCTLKEKELQLNFLGIEYEYDVFPCTSSNNLKLGLNVQPSVSCGAISHNLINRLNAQLKVGLGRAGQLPQLLKRSPWGRESGFSGKHSVTPGPAVQQNKYMDGLWSLKDLDLNPTSLFNQPSDLMLAT